MEDFRTQARAFLTEHFDAWRRTEGVTDGELTFEQHKKRWHLTLPNEPLSCLNVKVRSIFRDACTLRIR